MFGKLFGKKDASVVKGLYFWGGVGRGKTYLVDTFFEALPFEDKMRTHFHRFMKRVHEEMKNLKGDDLAPGVLKIVKVYLAIRRTDLQCHI